MCDDDILSFVCAYVSRHVSTCLVGHVCKKKCGMKIFVKYPTFFKPGTQASVPPLLWL